MSTTASSSAPSPSPSPSPSTSRQNRVSVWLPISAFIGTSLALAIPLYMLHRQRAGKNTFRVSFNKLQTAPPPRRSTTIPSKLTLLRTTSTSKQDPGTTSEPSDSSSSPGMGELISAISQINQSTAVLAAKAFFIATSLVAVGGITFTWAVKTTLGVENAREFGQKMRSIFQATVPGLRSRLYRAPETDDERYDIQTQGASLPSTIEQDWNWEEAEERLKRAYEEGGITVWAQTALRELEAEAAVERSKRDREQEADVASGKKNRAFP